MQQTAALPRWPRRQPRRSCGWKAGRNHGVPGNGCLAPESDGLLV